MIDGTMGGSQTRMNVSTEEDKAEAKGEERVDFKMTSANGSLIFRNHQMIAIDLLDKFDPN